MARHTRRLKIEDLYKATPVIPAGAVGFYKENCMVCFNSQEHKSGVKLEVSHLGQSHVFEVIWDGEVTHQLLRAYQDDNKITDFAACTIALMLVTELSDYVAIQQSSVGTTIDYYLVSKEDSQDDTLIFNHSAYLEISGIRHENPSNTVEGRIREKKQRLKKPENKPTLISVVEFGRPYTRTVEL
jgi:hypothetical protein